jgi:hypothetical protein
MHMTAAVFIPPGVEYSAQVLVALTLLQWRKLGCLAGGSTTLWLLRVS